MIPCTVKEHHTALLVEFDDGKSLLIQSDYEQADFAFSCGLFKNDSMENWLDNFGQYDLTDITECPEEYYDLAE